MMVVVRPQGMVALRIATQGTKLPSFPHLPVNLISTMLK
jgi:hypothetical protein